MLCGITNILRWSLTFHLCFSVCFRRDVGRPGFSKKGERLFETLYPRDEGCGVGCGPWGGATSDGPVDEVT